MLPNANWMQALYINSKHNPKQLSSWISVRKLQMWSFRSFLKTQLYINKCNTVYSHGSSSVMHGTCTRHQRMLTTMKPINFCPICEVGCSAAVRKTFFVPASSSQCKPRRRFVVVLQVVWVLDETKLIRYARLKMCSSSRIYYKCMSFEFSMCTKPSQACETCWSHEKSMTIQLQ